MANLSLPLSRYFEEHYAKRFRTVLGENKYRVSIRYFEELRNPATIDAITREEIETFRTDVQEAFKISKATAAEHAANVASVAKAAGAPIVDGRSLRKKPRIIREKIPRVSRYDQILAVEEQETTANKRRMPLLDYFRQHYLPDRQPSRETVERAILAIERFGQILKVEPTPEHVTFPALDRFAAEAPERFQISAGQVAKYRALLLAIARHAGVPGLPCKKTGPKPDPKAKRRNRRKRLTMLRDHERAARRRVIRVARMHVTMGLAITICANRLGVNSSTIESNIAKYRDRWEKAVRFYRRHHVPEPELSILEQWRIEVAVFSRVNGSSWSDIAEILGVDFREVQAWQIRNRTAWRAAKLLADKAARVSSLQHEIKNLLKREPEEDERRREEDATAPIEAITTLSGFFERCYLPTKLADAVPATLGSYRHCIRMFGRFVGREPLLADLTEDTLVGFLLFCTSKLENANVTANSRLRHLKAIAKLAKRRKLIPEMPEVDFLKVPRRRKVALSMDELGRLLGACQAQTGYVGSVPAGLWWYNLVAYTFRTALRKRSVLASRWDMLKGNVLTVPSEFVKTFCDAVFVLPHELVESLNKMPRDDSGLIFSLSCDERQFMVNFRRIRAQAGLEEVKDPMHQLRRTAATALANRFGLTTAQQVLHHACAATTQSYLDPVLSEAHATAAALPQPEAIPVDIEPEQSLTLAEILQLRQRRAEHYKTALKALGSNATELARRAGLHEQWVIRALRHWYPIVGEAAEKMDAALRELATEGGAI